MKLTKGEFSLFNFLSQKKLLSEKGISIFKLKINEKKEIRIYLIFDFYVEALCDQKTDEIEIITLNVNGIPEIYFE